MTLLCSRGLVGLVIVCVTCRQALGEDEAAPVSLPSAVQRGRELVATAATNWHQNKNCFACHHQTLPVLTLVEAGRFGTPVDPEWLRVQTKHTHDYFQERVAGMLAGEHVPGGASSPGFGLWALKLAQHPADDVTAAMVENLRMIQGVVRLSDRDATKPPTLRDGTWLPSCRRPPLQGSDIATTVLALIGMEHYATAEQRERLATARAAADKWLAETPLVTATDRAWRLWGLSLLGGEAATIEATRAVIFKTQRADGGWSETDDCQSDAYSTGETLFVLLQTGTPATDPAVLRTAHGNRLDVLRAENRTAAASPCMTTVVRDRRISDKPLTRWTDGSNLIVRPQSLAQSRLSLTIRQSPQRARRFQANTVLINHDDRRLVRAARQHDCIVPRFLASQREAAA